MTAIKTMKELADLAGVTTGTVSRALSDSPLISPKTRERVQALAREHGFRPNLLARNLRTQRTGAIGVLIPLGHEKGQHISDPFFITLLGFLADELTERGYDLLLSRVIPEDDSWLDQHIGSGKTDGILVIGQSDQSATLDDVAARFRPMVVWGGHTDGQVHCTVGSDNVRGGELAAQHLIARGCERIAFFGDPHALEIAQRLEGCQRALAQAGLSDKLTVLPAHLVAEAAHQQVVAAAAQQRGRARARARPRPAPRRERRPPRHRRLPRVRAGATSGDLCGLRRDRHERASGTVRIWARRARRCKGHRL